MTTQESAQTPEDAAGTTEAADAGKDTGGGLRKQLENSLAEVKELKADKRKRAFDDAGLDTTKGLGKAIHQVYEGEATKEAVVEFAKSEYDWTPPVSDEHPQAQQIQTEQARADQLTDTAGSVAPPSTADQLAKAEAEGDYRTAMAIKSQQVESMFK